MISASSSSTSAFTNINLAIRKIKMKKRVKNLSAAAETLKLNDNDYNNKLITKNTDNLSYSFNSNIIKSSSNNNNNNHKNNLTIELNDDYNNRSDINNSSNSAKTNRKLIKFNNLYKSLEVSLIIFVISILLLKNNDNLSYKFI